MLFRILNFFLGSNLEIQKFEYPHITNVDVCAALTSFSSMSGACTSGFLTGRRYHLTGRNRLAPTMALRLRPPRINMVLWKSYAISSRLINCGMNMNPRAVPAMASPTAWPRRCTKKVFRATNVAACPKPKPSPERGLKITTKKSVGYNNSFFFMS